MSSKRPLYDKILVKAEATLEKTSAGIFLPKNNEKSKLGEVVQVGAGIKLKDGGIKPLTVQIGDTVMFEKDAGYLMNVDGEKLLLMKEEEVQCIIDKE